MAPTMAAIAQAESSGDTRNTNPKPPDNSFGLWQINYYGRLASSRTKAFGTPESLLADPNAQAKAAISILKSQGLSAWSTYSDGAYKKYLTAAAPNTGGASPATGNAAAGGWGVQVMPTGAAAGGWGVQVMPTGAAGAAAGAPGANAESGGSLAGTLAADQSAIYSQRCLISAPSLFGIGGGCLLSKAEGRVMLGGLLMVGGGIVCTVGIILLASYGLQASGAAGAASKSAEVIGGITTALGAPEVGVPVAAAGAAGAHHDKARRQKGQARRARSDQARAAAKQARTTPETAMVES